MNVLSKEKSARFVTFHRGWPVWQMNVTPEQVVEAGFFFLGA